MTGVIIYVEGGGDKRNGRALLRQGIDAFLRSLKAAAQARGWRWNTVCCGGRSQTFRRFQDGVSKARNGAIVLLLVDAEAPVVAATPTEHLRTRQGDKWRFDGVRDDQVHLMVQTMERWIVADADALAEFYGPDFDKGALPRHSDIEAVGKAQVAAALERATSRTSKAKYHKIRHASELLHRIDPDKVRRRCRHCERLFATLDGVIASAP